MSALLPLQVYVQSLEWTKTTMDAPTVKLTVFTAIRRVSTGNNSTIGIY